MTIRLSNSEKAEHQEIAKITWFRYQLQTWAGITQKVLGHTIYIGFILFSL